MSADASRGAAITQQAKRLQLVETLLHVSQTVSAMETLDEVLAALVDLTVRETDADRGTLFLNDPATGELYSRVVEADRTLEIRFLNDVGIAGRVFTSRESLIINDASPDERIAPLLDRAREVLHEMKGANNISFMLGDGTLGWRQYGPYDAILVGAGAPEVPAAYTEQLADGGRWPRHASYQCKDRYQRGSNWPSRSHRSCARKVFCG